jgi:hypothetical protein
MKSSLQLAGILAGAAMILSSSAFAVDSYPMICHAGGAMRATISSGGTVRVNFNPTSDAASTTPPGPGQCGWLDRGFRTGEPRVLKYTGGLDGIHYLVDGVVGGGNFYVHVYNDGAGAMVVTRIGP